MGAAQNQRVNARVLQLLQILRNDQIFARACPMFVPLVENGYFNDGNPVTKLIIAE